MAAPTLDSIVRSAVDSSGTGTFIDVGHTSSGTNRVAICFPQCNPVGNFFGTTTYDAGSHTVSMNTTGGGVTWSNFRTQAYNLAGQATGANVCRANANAAVSVIGSIVSSFNGVNQTTSVSAPITNTGVSGAASIGATLATDELLVMHAFGFGASSASATAGAQILNQASGSWSGVFWVGTNSGVGSVNVQCNWDVSCDWGAIGYIIKPTAALTAKFSIPTNAANGTVRTLYVWADNTLASLLVPGIDVTASGGFFKFADTSATLGGSFPAMLTGFGSSAAVDAFGASAWATGIAE